MRVRGIAVIAMVGLLSTSHHASADVVMQTQTYCVEEESQLEYGNGAAVMRGALKTYKGGCNTAINRQAGYLAQGFWLLFTKTSGGERKICAASRDWTYNERPAWGFGIYHTIPAQPYCGPGYYQTRSFGFLFKDDAWRGGSVDSPVVYLEDSSAILRGEQP